VLSTAADELKARPAEVADRVTALLKRLRETEKALADAKREGLDQSDFTQVTAVAAAGYPVVFERFENMDAAELREMADRARGDSGAAVLASVTGDGVLLLASGTNDAVAKGFDAGAVIREIAPHIGGRGGGKPQMAQAGGGDPAGVDVALDSARGLLGAQ
jgi:alanyl-tRNA synthetase